MHDDIEWNFGICMESEIEAILASGIVDEWIDRLKRVARVEAVLIRDVVMFGPRVGFVLAQATCFDNEGNRLPGIAFLRGSSVAILLRVAREEATGLDDRIVLVRQTRVPIAEADYHEIPAGMLDGGDFRSKALDELAEEVGEDIRIDPEALEHIADLHPSPGGCDELIRLYTTRVVVTAEVWDTLSGRRTGAASENESITVVAEPLAVARTLAATDMKSRVAFDWLDARRAASAASAA